MPTTLTLTYEGPVAVVTLNRPEKRNAISPIMIDELLAALDMLEEKAVRAGILTGAGPAFCAGMDLAYLKTLAGETADRNLTDARRTAGLFRRIWSFPIPLIAAVNGAAMAGGCGLATLCDFTLASETATFGYTEVRVGFMPALVSMFLERQVGEKIARDLLLTGRAVDAHEAVSMGLATRVVAPDRLMAEARSLAATLVEHSPGSVAATKALLVETAEAEVSKGIELAIRASAEIRKTADYHEGLAAFLEKRKPQWSGR